MNIPVFHDDQHGTAIISAAAMLNGLGKGHQQENRRLIKVVCSGAGAAIRSCLDLWCQLGVKRENITVCDSQGVIYVGRRSQHAGNQRPLRPGHLGAHLGDAIVGATSSSASTAGVLKQEMVATMAKEPMVFALSNPTPEIMPELAKAVRPTPSSPPAVPTMWAQVNNVLCFPSSSAAPSTSAPPASPRR